MSMPLPNVDGEGERITRLFGRERPIHVILGGGDVADVLLWRNKSVSSTFFIGVMTLWFLFEVSEYNLVTFLCHLTITVMLVIFIWSNGAKVFKWAPPDIPSIMMEESMICTDLCKNLNFFLSRLHYIAYGNNIKQFGLVILTLLLLSMIGNYISICNLLFIGLVCMGTLPYFYENNEEQVDYYYFHTLNPMFSKMYKIYNMFDGVVVSKIPRWHLKEKQV
nr:reticulon-like protein B9 [Tanacetum cinerariifolium]